ncbi:MAG: lipase secretion chaperone [Betaproteobacteria bacterium]|nr:lipase secretion chaperone [Betaproteobacteria bacterium]
MPQPFTRTQVSLGLVGLVSVLAGWLFWPAGKPDATSPPLPNTSAANTPTGAEVRASGPFVRSMVGTTPDGDLRAIAGRLDATASLPYAELKRLFDYYLSAVGEQSIEAITQQIHSVLEQTIPATHIGAAKRLLAQYLEFKRALVMLEKNFTPVGPGAEAMRQRFTAMQALRARYFSPEETRGMFGFEDAYDLDALARLEISQNPALNAAQKKDQLALLDAALPAELREAHDAPRAVMKLEEMVQTLRTKGASDEEIYRVRAKEFGADAAARLAELDRDEQNWKNRITHYLSERRQLLKQQATASEADRQAALSQLQQTLFTPDERRRLAAYE